MLADANVDDMFGAYLSAQLESKRRLALRALSQALISSFSLPCNAASAELNGSRNDPALIQL